MRRTCRSAPVGRHLPACRQPHALGARRHADDAGGAANQVIAPAVDQLDGQCSAAVRLYDVEIGHIIDMADMLSTGIMEQFPARFR
jgi:hypothetical protein